MFRRALRVPERQAGMPVLHRANHGFDERDFVCGEFMNEVKCFHGLPEAVKTP